MGSPQAVVAQRPEGRALRRALDEYVPVLPLPDVSCNQVT